MGGGVLVDTIPVRGISRQGKIWHIWDQIKPKTLQKSHFPSAFGPRNLKIFRLRRASKQKSSLENLYNNIPGLSRWPIILTFWGPFGREKPGLWPQGLVPEFWNFSTFGQIGVTLLHKFIEPLSLRPPRQKDQIPPSPGKAFLCKSIFSTLSAFFSRISQPKLL